MSKVDPSGRIASLLRDGHPADPAPDLVDRIMQGIPADADEPEAAIDRWIRMAWPVAVATCAVVTVLAFSAPFGTDEAVVADPIASIGTNAEADVRDVLALRSR